MAESRASAETRRELPVVAFAGGGTAGHVFPGLAVAEELEARIVWIGSARGVERKLVTDAGIDFRGIPAGKLRRYLSFRNLSDVARTVAGVCAAVRVLRRERPALLFSKGGFVSVPPVVAAWLCGIPSWTHESDFDPGLATRINAIFCEKVLVSFAETVGSLPARYREKAFVTGNPVRKALYSADAARGRAFVGCDAATPMILVIGGSLGSSFINGLIVSCLPELLSRFFIVHQMGSSEFRSSQRQNYFPSPFIAGELPDIMAAADLVICRAGANTLAELAALGKPSILIPLPRTGSRGDQIANAEVFRAAGASLVIPEHEATSARVVPAVCSLLGDRARLREMGLAAGSLGGGRPAEAIARLILQRLR
jgi:UDP-N-acetylglucosamine--N-acetylmuramyl-(pentapeptide) pyrophosphoryl-undecaprenol N-acetylglucosamine transferase